MKTLKQIIQEAGTSQVEVFPIDPFGLNFKSFRGIEVKSNGQNEEILVGRFDTGNPWQFKLDSVWSDHFSVMQEFQLRSVF